MSYADIQRKAQEERLRRLEESMVAQERQRKENLQKDIQALALLIERSQDYRHALGLKSGEFLDTPLHPLIIEIEKSPIFSVQSDKKDPIPSWQTLTEKTADMYYTYNGVGYYSYYYNADMSSGFPDFTGGRAHRKICKVSFNLSGLKDFSFLEPKTESGRKRFEILKDHVKALEGGIAANWHKFQCDNGYWYQAPSSWTTFSTVLLFDDSSVVLGERRCYTAIVVPEEWHKLIIEQILKKWPH